MAVQTLSCHYRFLNEASSNVCPGIFKFPFKTVKDTKIPTFQY